MATCKECLCYEMCYILEENPWEGDVDGVENDCPAFKNKTKYVDVRTIQHRLRCHFVSAVHQGVASVPPTNDVNSQATYMRGYEKGF